MNIKPNAPAKIQGGVAKISKGELAMEDIRKKIDNVRRKLDDLVVELCQKAKENDHHPNFHIKDACHNATLGLQKANNELFYAHTALL